MPEVSIGVPVFNGAEYLATALTCLRDQTFRDIEVLVFDNCSQDATGDIAKSFCQADSRFRYVRHDQNRGAVPNFMAALEAAQGPLFMWRAADDTSSLDYVDRLRRLLLAHPDRDLAVPKTLEVAPDGTLTRVKDVPPLTNGSGYASRVSQIFDCYFPTWVYGLCRRDRMIPVVRRVLSTYPYTWDWDAAAMFPFVFEGKVIGDNGAILNKLVQTSGARLDRAQRARRLDEKFEMATCLAAFKHRYIEDAPVSRAEKLVFHSLVSYYGLTRNLSIGRRVRHAARNSLGYVKSGAAS